MGNKKDQFDQYPNLGFKPSRILKALEVANDNPDGFTISNDMAEMPGQGYAVALAATQGSFGLPGFLRALAFAIDNGLHFGGWLNKEDGQYYWDAVRVFPQGQLQAADAFARQQGQIALFNLDEGIVMDVPVNGDRIIIDSVFPEESEEIAYSQYSVGDKLVVAGNESGHNVEFGASVLCVAICPIVDSNRWVVVRDVVGGEFDIMACDLDFADTDDGVVVVGSSPEEIETVLVQAEVYEMPVKAWDDAVKAWDDAVKAWDDAVKAADDYEYRFHTWRTGKELFVIQNTCGHELPIGSKVVVLNPTICNNESFYDVNFVGGEAGDWYQIHQDDLGE